MNKYKHLKYKHLILFDGVCNLCNFSVQFILKRDKKNKFNFTSLQSDAANKILLQYNNEKFNPKNLKSIILIENNKIYTKSTAVLRIVKQMYFPFSLLYFFIIIPKFIRDYLYEFIAKYRYAWFGKKDSCMIPKKEYLNKFI
jgi:predicted DCC family thiol-disulfide oxidoreductase YuxK